MSSELAICDTANASSTLDGYDILYRPVFCFPELLKCALAIIELSSEA
jgi:hypothetical protein